MSSKKRKLVNDLNTDFPIIATNTNTNSTNSSSSCSSGSDGGDSGGTGGPSHRATPRITTSSRRPSVAAQLSKSASLAFYEAYHSPTVFYRLIQARASTHGPLFLSRTLSYRYPTRKNVRSKTDIAAFDDSLVVDKRNQKKK